VVHRSMRKNFWRSVRRQRSPAEPRLEWCDGNSALTVHVLVGSPLRIVLLQPAGRGHGCCIRQWLRGSLFGASAPRIFFPVHRNLGDDIFFTSLGLTYLGSTRTEAKASLSVRKICRCRRRMGRISASPRCSGTAAPTESGSKAPRYQNKCNSVRTAVLRVSELDAGVRKVSRRVELVDTPS